jgi:two-component system response regulator ChvI
MSGNLTEQQWAEARVAIDMHGRQIGSLERGRLRIDAPRWLVTWDGVPLRLPPAPLLLVHCLASRPGIVRSRNDLLADINDPRGADTFDRSVDTHVKRARQAFRMVDPSFDQIEAVYCVGYKWRGE